MPSEFWKTVIDAMSIRTGFQNEYIMIQMFINPDTYQVNQTSQIREVFHLVTIYKETRKKYFIIKRKIKLILFNIRP